ncbi:MAG: hypothetical protein HYS09_10070 [Chloroflexi bacterium]|nr:hypothetical protein [Chloroflexota bacterium]
MTTEIQPEQRAADLAEAPQIISALRRQVTRGRKHWFVSLLEAIGRWHLPEETVNGRTYRYLIGGEAFDWLLLAERLIQAIDDRVEPGERDSLLFRYRFPTEVTDEEFRRLIGPAKYRAHLNFFYGVLVEEALQLAVEEEVHKERLATRIWENGRVEDETHHRIYGATRDELLASFREQRALPPADQVSLTELREFTYWLFKERLHRCDPARVASDTRKGLARLNQIEAARRLKRPRSTE